MHFIRMGVIRAVFQYSTTYRHLHYHGNRLYCISLCDANLHKSRSQVINKEQFSTQPDRIFVSARNICFTSSSTKRTFCSKPQVDAMTSLPLHDPEKGNLIYGGPLAQMIKGVKTFSLSTSLIGLCLQPYLFLHSEGHSIVAKIAVGTTISFFVFITPLLIHWVTKKYVTDCYFNKDTNTFTASTISFLLRRKTLKFTPEDVVVPDVPGMFTSIIVKGRPLFMDPKFFYSREAYILMMGYDKPLDWELPNTLDENQSAQKSEKS